MYNHFNPWIIVSKVCRGRASIILDTWKSFLVLQKYSQAHKYLNTGIISGISCILNHHSGLETQGVYQKSIATPPRITGVVKDLLPSQALVVNW